MLTFTPPTKPDPAAERANHWTALRRLLPFVWPKERPDLRARVVLALIALLAAKLITVAVPIAYKAAVDWLAEGAGSASGSISFVALASLPIALIVIYGVGRVLMVGLAQLRDVLFAEVAQHAVRSLANLTFRHLHFLSLRFHLERRTGGLSRIIERGVHGVETIVRLAILNTIPTAIELVLVGALLAYYFGWTFLVVVAATVLIYGWFTLKASEWRIAIRREMNDSDTEANSKAIDSLLNYETVKYFGNEDHEAHRFDSSMERYEAAAVRTFTSLGVLNSGQAFIYTVGLVLCMLLAANGVAKGTLTLGDFVMVNALLVQLYMPLNFMGMVYREIRQGLVDLETMFALLEREPEIVDAPGARPLLVDRGDIRFDNVCFAYEPDRPILKSVSFEVPAGKMVAVVGPSGAGKSTISRILYRFYEIDSGRVTIDGQDIAKVTQQSLREAIGMVPQDTVLFNDTIAYNISYGRPDASFDEIREAAKMAQIQDFIEGLPQGYDTLVGERGLKLSGGEKQRVAIARTILKGPPILLLDEATSALDSYTEKEIQESLAKLEQNRTTLVIAHRLSTIVNAHEIIVMESGKVVERGRHAELVASGGLYAGMWARQREAEEARERLAHRPEEDKEIALLPQDVDFLGPE